MFSYIDEAWGNQRPHAQPQASAQMPLASMGLSAPAQYGAMSNDAPTGMGPQNMIDELMQREQQQRAPTMQQQPQQPQYQQTQAQYAQVGPGQQYPQQQQTPAYYQQLQAAGHGQQQLDAKDVMILKLRGALKQAYDHITSKAAQASCKKWEITVIVLVVLLVGVLVALIVLGVRLSKKPRLQAPRAWGQLAVPTPPGPGGLFPAGPALAP